MARRQWSQPPVAVLSKNATANGNVPLAREYLAQQMESYFFGDGADQVQGYVPIDEPK